MKYVITDMPKLHSPFVRVKGDTGYCVTPMVEEGFEWVFTDDSVIAVEKLNGTNVSVLVDNGVVTAVWNRDTRLPFFNRGKRNIIEGVMEAYDRGYIDMLLDGQHFGELIGPRIQGNPYNLTEPLWIPFETYSQRKLVYRSWGKYPKTFDAISEWFKDLPSAFMLMRGDRTASAEGIVFTRPADGAMAKLRVDMFVWYTGRRH